MFIVDAKVKELIYSGNTAFLLLPSRDCMRETFFFWSPSQSAILVVVRQHLIGSQVLTRWM